MDALPTELIIEICRYLCPHCYPGEGAQELLSTADRTFATMEPRDREKMKRFLLQNHLDEQGAAQEALATLCRVSKRISTIATPILYHCLSEGRGTKFGTTRFLSVISSKPDLGACVRSFAPVLWDFLGRKSSDDDSICHHDPIKIPRDRRLDWLVSRNECYPVTATIDAFLVGLAWAAQSVEEIAINPQDLLNDDEDPHWDFLPDDGFPSLRTLELRLKSSTAYYSNIVFGSGPMAYLLQAAPVLQTLKLSSMYYIGYDLPFLNSLRSITITETVLEEAEIRCLIDKLPSIEEFKYHAGYPNRFQISPPEGVEEEITPYRLFCHLARRGNTLKRIDVDQSWRTYTKINHGHAEQMVFVDEVTPSLLEHFPVLEHLKVNAEDVFPCHDRNEQDNDDADDQDDDNQPVELSRNRPGERLLGLVPPTLKSLTVRGLCPYFECMRLSDCKALGKSGECLETVKFGDVRNVDMFGLIDNAHQQIIKHFKQDAGVKCEIMAVKNQETVWDWVLGPPEDSESGEADGELMEI